MPGASDCGEPAVIVGRMASVGQNKKVARRLRLKVATRHRCRALRLRLNLSKAGPWKGVRL